MACFFVSLIHIASETADLLQDLHLDSDNKSLQARDSIKQVLVVAFILRLILTFQCMPLDENFGVFALFFH